MSRLILARGSCCPFLLLLVGWLLEKLRIVLQDKVLFAVIDSASSLVKLQLVSVNQRELGVEFTLYSRSRNSYGVCITNLHHPECKKMKERMLITF